jgi:hypothetical protein
MARSFDAQRDVVYRAWEFQMDSVVDRGSDAAQSSSQSWHRFSIFAALMRPCWAISRIYTKAIMGVTNPPKLREFWRRFLQVLDDFAEVRARKAVRQSELLRVQREMDSYHELIVDRSLLQLGEHHMKPRLQARLRCNDVNEPPYLVAQWLTGALLLMPSLWKGAVFISNSYAFNGTLQPWWRYQNKQALAIPGC